MGEVEATAETAETVAPAEEAAPDGDSNVTITVENFLPDNTPTFYSDGMLVLHSANEFILSFLQTDYPLAGSKEELQQVKSVKRKCIARIIVSPAQLEAVANALRDNLKKYQDSFKKPQAE